MVHYSSTAEVPAGALPDSHSRENQGPKNDDGHKNIKIKRLEVSVNAKEG
jgi:hypothetical protein